MISISWTLSSRASCCFCQGETNEECAVKAAYAQEHGLSVMGCIGESKEERESG